MSVMPTERLSARAVVASLLIVLVAGVAAHSIVVVASESRSVVKWDGVAYFLFARTIVVDRDFDVASELEMASGYFEQVSVADVRSFTYVSPTSGRVRLPWPLGSGVVMAPFYAIGWVAETSIATVTNRPADSYGNLPQRFFAVGSLVYCWLGMLCSYLICCAIAPRAQAALAVASVFLGGTLAFYTMVQPAMMHAASFGMAGLAVYLWWPMWHQWPQSKRMAVLGAVVGALLTVRYQNALFALLPAVLAVKVAWYQGLRRMAMVTAATLGGFMVPASLLVVYEFWFAGARVPSAAEFIAAGRNPLDWSSPHFLDVLFSCQHGLMYWTPVLGLGLIGLCLAARRCPWARVFVAITLANVWVIGGLESQAGNWSGGAAFGARYLTESSVFFAAGLAWLMAAVWKKLSLMAASLILGTLVVANLLLMGLFVTKQISPIGCVTHRDMIEATISLLRTL